MSSLSGSPLDQSNNLSALEKVRLLKQQKEEADKIKAELSEAEKQAKQKELDEKYLVTKKTADDLKSDKIQLDTEITGVREGRKQNIFMQRAAIKEMVGSGEADDIELFKENKKEIFKNEEEGLKLKKTTEKDLKSKSKDLEGKIVSTDQELEESYKETSEGKAEKEKVDQETNEKELSELKNQLKDVYQKVKNTFKLETDHTTDIDKAISNRDFGLGYKIENLNKSAQNIKNLEATFQEFLDYPIVKIKTQNGEWITSGKIEEAVDRGNKHYKKIRDLEDEKRKLDEENRKAPFSFGNGKRNNRIKEIDEEINSPANAQSLQDENWSENVSKKDKVFSTLTRGEYASYNENEENYLDYTVRDQLDNKIKDSVGYGRPLGQIFKDVENFIPKALEKEESQLSSLKNFQTQIEELKAKISEKEGNSTIG